MPAPSLGKKYTCFKCQTKFYDLGKTEAVCPKCGSDQRDGPSADRLQAVLTRLSSSGDASERRPRSRTPDFEEPEVEDLEESVGEMEHFEEEEFTDDFDDDAEPPAEEPDEDY